MISSFAFGMAPLMMLVGLAGSTGVPLGIPPGPEEPLMFQVAPQECVFYMTWAGTAEPDPDSTNQIEQLLAEKEVQHLLAEAERLIRAGMANQAKEEGPETVAFVDEAVGWVKTLLTSPTAVFISDATMGPDGPDVRGGVVVKVGDDAMKMKAALAKYQQVFLGEAAEAVQIDGQTWYRLKLDPQAPEITWGVKGKCLIAGIGKDSVEGILARASTEPPKWLTELREKLPVKRTSTVAYLNVRKIIATFAPMGGLQALGVLNAVGLGNVTSLGGVSGLDDEGFVGRTLLAVEGEPKGLLAALTAKSLSPADLAPIPADATVAIAARVDVQTLLNSLLVVVQAVDQNAFEEALDGLDEMKRETGVDLRNDLLAAVGDSWTVYYEGHLGMTGLTAVAKIKDRERLVAVQEKLVAMLQAPSPEPPPAEDEFVFGRERDPRIEKFQFAGQDVFVYDSGQMFFFVSPSWCLTENELVVALFPQNIKAYLSRDSEFKSLAEEPRVAAMFSSGEGPIALSYYDTRELFDMAYSTLLFYIQFGKYELGEAGMDLKMSMFPSPQSIRKHLLPSTMQIRRTKAGIELTSRQGIPGGNLVMTVPLAAGMGLVGWARFEVDAEMQTAPALPEPDFEESTEPELEAPEE